MVAMRAPLARSKMMSSTPPSGRSIRATSLPPEASVETILAPGGSAIAADPPPEAGMGAAWLRRSITATANAAAPAASSTPNPITRSLRARMFRSTLAAMNAETLQARVGSEVAGERLDRFLAAALAGFSRSRLKNLVESGQVSLEGAAVTDPAMRVKPGQVFTLAVPPPENATPKPQAMALDIVFEDEHLLVLDKPAGLVVHPAPGNPDGTLVNALLAHCGASLAGIGGVKRPGI